MSEAIRSKEYRTYTEAQVAREAFQMVGIDPFSITYPEKVHPESGKFALLKNVFGRMAHHPAADSVAASHGDAVRNTIEQKLIGSFDLRRGGGLYNGEGVHPLQLAGAELDILRAGLETYVAERASLQAEDYAPSHVGTEMVSRARTAERMLSQLEESSTTAAI